MRPIRHVGVRHQLIIGKLHQLTNAVHRNRIKTMHVAVRLIARSHVASVQSHHIIIFTDNLWMRYSYWAIANVMRSPK